MSNRLSQSLAEVWKKDARLKSLELFDASQISLFYKYVDDVFAAVHRDFFFFFLRVLCGTISASTSMAITVTEVDVTFEVDFLNCTFKRNADGTVSSRWFKKRCCSFQTLNYHSNHRWSVKDNNVKEMIRFSFDVTTSEFIRATRSLLIKVLCNSSYPSNYIQRAMYEYENELPPIPSSIERPCYVSCPAYRPTVDAINCVISKRNIPVRISASPYSNNKKILLSKVKDSRPNGYKKRFSAMIVNFHAA